MKIKNAVMTGVLAIGFSQLANAQGYSFTDLGTLGGNNSSATGINNAGQVVGQSDTGQLHQWSPISTPMPVWHATLWSGGTATDLGTFGGLLSTASSINNNGQIAGWAQTSTNQSAGAVWNSGSSLNVGNFIPTAINDAGTMVGGGAVWNSGTVTPIPLGGYYAVSARDINNSGQIVGFRTTNGNQNDGATLWSGGTSTELGTLYGTGQFSGGVSDALAINDSGQIVGYMIDPRKGSPYVTATLWDHGTITDLGLPGEQQSVAHDINNRGEIVGYTSGHDGRPYAALWSGGVFTNLSTFISQSMASEGWRIFGAWGINDDGWIAVNLINDRSGYTHAGLLKPCETCQPIELPPVAAVPEPETYAMMLAGLGLLGLMARRRKQKLNA